jgi:antitoxin (DNA-binding transcriptional repressor) of toxin-antitoxin stability system
MKVIDLNEAKTNLEQYARECQVSPVVVTVDGKPAFEMLPVRAEDDDFMDRLIEENNAFRELLEQRRREADTGRVSSLEEIRRRLG